MSNISVNVSNEFNKINSHEKSFSNIISSQFHFMFLKSLSPFTLVYNLHHSN